MRTHWVRQVSYKKRRSDSGLFTIVLRAPSGEHQTIVLRLHQGLKLARAIEQEVSR